VNRIGWRKIRDVQFGDFGKIFEDCERLQIKKTDTMFCSLEPKDFCLPAKQRCLAEREKRPKRSISNGWRQTTVEFAMQL
jgi:hypothetical protein